jgi:hypothetical protein
LCLREDRFHHCTSVLCLARPAGRGGP